MRMHWCARSPAAGLFDVSFCRTTNRGLPHRSALLGQTRFAELGDEFRVVLLIPVGLLFGERAKRDVRVGDEDFGAEWAGFAMTDFTALREHLLQVRHKALVTLADRSQDKFTAPGLLALLGDVQGAFAAVEEEAGEL